MADKFKDKLKFFMGLDSDDEEETNVVESTSTEPLNFERVDLPREPLKKVENPIRSINESRVIPMSNEVSKVNVTILKPEDFNDAASVVNNLKAEKPVIVNLEALDHNEARKIFDFCSGALYALNGRMFKVSKNIFLMAPENVDISGNLNNSVDTEFEME
jgi:cell division inhibitor SepF